ncbi:MAG: BMC domain-containing protein [Gemmatimonadales bacterium]|nr:BMC domain-containing protein [Gemmatimonadales bacterium]
MSKSLALMEFQSVAVGVLAVDRMLKKSPVALLRCGTVHPGRYLALVGGSVAATEEAYTEGVAVGRESSVLVDEVYLADPHPSLAILQETMVSSPVEPDGDTVGVLEVSTSATLLRILDAVLKAVPITLTEIRLGDDLGGKALAVITGLLSDVQEAVRLAGDGAGISDGVGGEVLGASIMSNVDQTLRQVLGEGTHFARCRNWMPGGAEILED